jgi:pyruvate formate lyase activating enzyme
MKPALFSKPDPSTGALKCALCPHCCTVYEEETGTCRARKNIAGELVSLTYGEISSIHVDPIEKKPLYHFYPGSSILSVGTTGCNLRCSFCQNWEISQVHSDEIPTQSLSPDEAVNMAGKDNSIGIAYTFNEPVVNYEWVKDTAQLLHMAGLKNVLVTNGFINPEPWKELLPFIDAANIDVKAFSEEFYRGWCGGTLAPVLKTVELMAESCKHVEVTMLLIPGENDSPKDIEAFSEWLARVSPDIPVHFSRYFPQFKMEKPHTPLDTLVKAYTIAKKKLKYVYLGNVDENEYSTTFCPSCESVLIQRSGCNIKPAGLNGSVCKKCGTIIDLKM